MATQVQTTRTISMDDIMRAAPPEHDRMVLLGQKLLASYYAYLEQRGAQPMVAAKTQT